MHARTQAHTHTHTRTHTHTHTLTHTHAHTHAHMHTHTRTHARTHSRTHAHTQFHSPPCKSEQWSQGDLHRWKKVVAESDTCKSQSHKKTKKLTWTNGAYPDLPTPKYFCPYSEQPMSIVSDFSPDILQMHHQSVKTKYHRSIFLLFNL